MPRLLPRSVAVEAETKGWVRRLIRTEMLRRGLTFKDLAQLLTAEGLAENEGNLRSKVSRGELSGSMLLAALYVMQCKTVNIRELPLRDDADPDDVLVTIDSALNNPLVRVVARDDAKGAYEIRIGELNTIVSVTLERRADLGFVFKVSHHIVIVDDPYGGPSYLPCFGFGTTPAKALQRAVKYLTEQYDAAVRGGYKPSESWLRACPSTDFSADTEGPGARPRRNKKHSSERQ